MKGLRFNLRTLFVVTALLAGVIYAGWRFSKWYSTGSIFENGFAVQSEDDGRGLLLTITGSNLPIESVEFELRRNFGSPEQSLICSTGRIRIEPCSEKLIRLQRNTSPELAVDNQELCLIVRLPQFLDGSSYTLQLPQQRTYQHEGCIHSGNCWGFLQIKDDQQREYGLWMCVNPLP